MAVLQCGLTLSCMELERSDAVSGWEVWDVVRQRTEKPAINKDLKKKKEPHHPEGKRKGPALFSSPLKLDKKPWTQLIVMWSSENLCGVRGPLAESILQAMQGIVLVL